MSTLQKRPPVIRDAVIAAQALPGLHPGYKAVVRYSGKEAWPLCTGQVLPLYHADG